jgi:hypothetical protein
MEDFLVQAQETLDKVNDSSEKVKQATKFLQWVVALGFLTLLALFTDIKIELSRKADANDVVHKRNALVIEKLKITNDERVAAALVDTTSTLELIKQYNQNYLWQIEGIYDINYRGK